MTSSRRRRYVRRPDMPVVAVRLALDTDGLVYRKWGGEQRAKAGDWLVDNDGDVYTVAADVFERTYRNTNPGQWIKTTPVWATRASEDGDVATKEGRTWYRQGDYVVSNNEDGSDAYAISAKKFEQTYEPDD